MFSRPATPAIVVSLAILAAACGGETAEAPEQKEQPKALPAELAATPPTKGQLKVALAADAAGATESSIAFGETVQGSLEIGDPTLPDGQFYDVWRFEGSAGDWVSIRMESDPVDPYLYLERVAAEGTETVAADDDGAGNYNSLIEMSLPASAAYEIVATSFDSGEVGPYHLSLAATEPPWQSIPESGAVEGRLEDSDPTFGEGEHYDAWIFQGRAGDRVEIATTSDEIDTYLVFGTGTPDQFWWLDENDDGGEWTNSRIAAPLPDDGIYTVYVTSYQAGETGAYSLSVSASTPDVTSRYPGGGDPAGRYAVLVGIADYPGEGADLGGPIEDARAVRRLLVDHYGFSEQDVVTITDSEATRDEIANAVLRHLGQAGEDGLAVLYFSGHGMQMDENAGLRSPLDPEPDDLDEALYVWGYGSRGGVLLDDELGYLLDRLDAGRKLIILDSCNSGTGVRGPGRVRGVTLATLSPRPYLPARGLVPAGALGSPRASEVGSVDVFGTDQNYVLLAAAAADEYAWEGTGEGVTDHGVFTTYLTRALEAVDDETTFAELMSGIRNEVLRVTREEFGEVQTPQVEGDQADRPIRSFLGAR